MRAAIFSDIHSNLFAFEAVLKDIKKRQVDKLICLGDIVGYGARPAECLKMVRKSGADVVMGNHDFYSATKESLDWFNPVAAAGLLFSRKALTAAQKKWLLQLPLFKNFDGFTVVHSSLADPKEWDYVTDDLMAHLHFLSQELPVCFIGHTHQVKTYRLEEGRVCKQALTKNLKLKKGVKYVINVGSVGQPRDNNPDSAYAIYDTVEGVVEFQRVSYPVDEAAAEIIQAGLPEHLGLRLRLGC